MKYIFIHNKSHDKLKNGYLKKRLPPFTALYINIYTYKYKYMCTAVYMYKVGL